MQASCNVALFLPPWKVSAFSVRRQEPILYEENWPHRSPLSKLRWQRSLSLPLHPFLGGQTEDIAATVSAQSLHYFSLSPLCLFFYIFKISERAQELQNQLSEIPFVSSACGDLFHILLGIWYLTCWHFIWKRDMMSPALTSSYTSSLHNFAIWQHFRYSNLCSALITKSQMASYTFLSFTDSKINSPPIGCFLFVWRGDAHQELTTLLF